MDVTIQDWDREPLSRPRFQGRKVFWLPSIQIEVEKPLNCPHMWIEIEKPLNPPQVQIEIEKPFSYPIFQDSFQVY